MTGADGGAVAAVWAGMEAGFSIEAQPLPELRPGEALVAIELATICGSDLHTTAGHRTTPLPTVLGHEAVGRVVATHGDVRSSGGPLRSGDRVTWTIGTSCGSCSRCLRGLTQKCVHVRKYGHEAMEPTWRLNGGLASHCHLLSGTGIVAVPEDMSPAVAAPANCASATVVGAARRVGLSDDDDVVVVLGCGMLGLTAVAYAGDRGATTIVACDTDPGRRGLAQEFGASVVCAPEQLASVLGADGAEVVLELSGSSSAVQLALESATVGGRVALVGSVSPVGGVSLHPDRLVRNLTTVVGCHNYRVDDLAEAVAFLGRTPHGHRFAQLVPEVFDLTEVDVAFARARSGSAPRVAVRAGNGPH